MFKRILLFATAIAAFIPAFADDNVVWRDGDTRITLISERVARLEYAPGGEFVDNKSFIAVNRDYPKVDATVSTSGKKVTITTSAMEITYEKGSGKFTKKNLAIRSLLPDASFTWHPGDKQKGNLKGTYRTLDGYDGNLNNGEPMPIEDGILATDGWTFIDDSEGLLFDNSEWAWAQERKSNKGQDWYFMVYGSDYKAALKDFTLFSGKVPLPPRYAFGYWWSRYWCYTDTELRALVDRFNRYDVPLDVLVIDMDWHYTEPGKGGWTGWTWNRNLFPSPEGILSYIKSNNLQITLNLHPADGVDNYEESYQALREAMGYPEDYNKRIDFQVSDKKFMTNWFNKVLHPMQDMGVDFWWLDWQQHIYDTRMTKLHNTWWLNYCVFTDMERNFDCRPMLYHRWGGLGNHRYQIGFSGDSSITWDSLDFQPYFNSTASNVLYGFWSHDIGGHHFGIGRIDPEMYVRWMQFGMLSPILRTHSTKNAALKKEPWQFEQKYSDILTDCIRLRYALSPYIYTMARLTHDEGLSICRPMYYDYPKAQEAYEMKNEYMFGDCMLVNPITSTMGDADYCDAQVWLPEGSDWYEVHTGTLLEGGQTVTRSFALDEFPLYIKAGSIIPMTEGLKNLRSNDAAYILNVYPGKSGSFNIYEDNGNDKGYETNFATTAVSSTMDGKTMVIDIAPRQGSYEGMPAQRNYSVKVHGYAPAARVEVDGQEVKAVYDGNTLTMRFDIPDSSCDVAHRAVITYPDNAVAIADGLLGNMKHVVKATADLKYRDAGISFRQRLACLESAGAAINYEPERFNEIVAQFRNDYSDLPKVLEESPMSDENRAWFLKAVNWK